MHIRPMMASDAEEVAALTEQLGYPATTVQIVHRLGLLMEQPGNALFVAEDGDERIMGWIHVVGRVYLDSDPFAQVGGIVVDERRRGQGVGRALLTQAEQWAEARGYDELRLWSSVMRAGAHAFYERLGYEPVKTSYVFRKTL
ncbi:MAG TPA: GNAT family N-acetyltransferase [Ktedonobacterales bacterium]|nr:GNAT family N-acetyltransferase [Ktedonobacterales bacterium]